MCEGITFPEVKKGIQKAMPIGMYSQDPKVQTYWKRILHEGDIPRPEEVIVFLAEEGKK